MNVTAKFLSTALSGSVFSASANFAGLTRSLTIDPWGGATGDTTPPVLSNPTGTQAGSTGGVGGVTTDEGNGTLYWVVTPSTAATPSAAAIKAGTGAVSSGSQAVFSAGQKATSPAASGLTAQTSYRFHFVQTDAAGNDSNVVTSTVFTTDAMGSGTGTVTALIKARYPFSVAPEGIQFEAAVSGATVSAPSGRNARDEQFHKLIYIWDFGDPGAVSDKVVNLPAVWNDLNQGRGKFPIHVYGTPGTYTATCSVYELGGTFVGSDTVSVTIGDPATVFPGNRTILVDPAGAGDTTTYPDSQVVTTWDAGLTALTSLGTTGRLLLKRGETFTMPAAVNVSGSYDNFHIGAWGTGARPVLIASTSFSSTMFNGFSSFSGRWMCFVGVDLRGNWDSITETGSDNTCISPLDCHMLVHDCRISGVNNATSGQVAAGLQYMYVMNNTEVTNFRNFGFYNNGSQDAYLGMIGCAVFHDPNAMEGRNGSSGGPGNKHGPSRLPNGQHVYIDACDLFSRSGWPGDHQACLRPNSTTVPGAWTSTHITRCAMEGGSPMIQISHNGAGSVEGCNMLIEDSLMVGTAATGFFVASQYPGQTYRNLLMIKPNTQTFSGSGFWFGAFRRFYAPDSENFLAGGLEQAFYNNTVVLLPSDANQNGDLYIFAPNASSNNPDMAAWSGFVEAGNVLHTPNFLSQEPFDPGLTPTALATVGGTWTSRFLGRKWNDWGQGDSPASQTTMDTSWATPSGQVMDYVPDIGSPLLGASGSPSIFRDMFGNPLNGTRDAGARERS